MMRLRYRRWTALIVLVFFSFNAYAWNALSHKVIANIAYQELTPSAREKVNAMVRNFGKEYSYIHYFTQLAPWADTLRGQKVELFARWHYIDIPFSDDGSALKNTINSDNAVWAINQLEPIIKNPHANAFERARALAFLVHLIGDIHQPLHASTRISKDHPDGDKGGNLFYILSPFEENQSVPLHHFWDSAFDANTDPAFSNVSELTRVLLSKYPPDYFGSKIKDLSPQDWALESTEISRTFVYTTKEHQLPSSDYLDTKKPLSEKRVALAGYRLAIVLNALLN